MEEAETTAGALPGFAGSHRERWSIIQSRIEVPSVDPRLSTLGPSQSTIGTPRLPAISSLGLHFPSRGSPPPTQRWPFHPLRLPPIGAALKPSTHPTFGDRSSNDYPPLSPLSFHPTSTRNGVSVAELSNEETLLPGTHDGVRSPPPPAATCGNTLLAQSYPPLSVSVVDVTPHFTLRTLEAPEVSELKPLRSPPPPPPETPRLFFTQVPASIRGPPTSPACNDRRRAASAGKETRGFKRKGATLASPEVPDRRATSGVKVKVSEDDKVPTKRAKIGSP